MKNKYVYIIFSAVLVGILAACQSSINGKLADGVVPTATESGIFVSPEIQNNTLFSPVEPVDATYGHQRKFPGKIAFHSDRTGLLEVYVMDGETGQIDLITSYNEQAFEPSWSPDCGSITFSYGGVNTANLDIYKMALDGDGVAVNISNNPAHNDWMSSWSPKGDLIAYQTDSDGLLNICFMDIEGQHKGCLGHSGYNNAMVSWSPNGEKVVFISDRDGDWDIFLASAESESHADVIQVTKNKYNDTQPQISPDGTKIAFVAHPYTNFDIFVMDIDGSNVQQLTTSLDDDVMPHWIGNKRLVFASNRTQDWELYQMNSDGKEVEQLTNTPGLDKWPVWCSNE